MLPTDLCRVESIVSKREPSDAAKRATSLTNLSQEPITARGDLPTVAHSPNTARGDLPTVAHSPNTARGDLPTVVSNPATVEGDLPTVYKPPASISRHKQINGEVRYDKRPSVKNRGSKRVSVT